MQRGLYQEMGMAVTGEKQEVGVAAVDGIWLRPGCRWVQSRGTRGRALTELTA